MSLETLLDAIRREAEERREETLARAREKAEGIVSAAREEAEERLREERARAEEEARTEAAARLAQARREGREQLLAARAEALGRIFEEARDRLAAAAGSGAYGRALPRVLTEALAQVSSEAPTILCSPGLSATVEKALRADPDGRELASLPVVREEPGLPPGFRIQGGGDDLVVDGSLEAALRRLRPRLSIEIVDRVGGEEATGEPVEQRIQEPEA